MKRLLDMPIVDVLHNLAELRVPQPITVEQGLCYLMFMQAISDDLVQVGGDSMKLTMERINQLAKEHGGYVEQDWTTLAGPEMHMAIIHNSQQELFFERLAHYTARLLTARV